MKRRCCTYSSKAIFYAFSFVAGCFCLFAGCQRELILENPTDEHLVVMNGVFVADTAPVQILLSYSQTVIDTTTSVKIETAQVKLYCNDTLIGDFEYAGNGVYRYDIAPVSGKTYRVEAVVDSLTVWAETTIPDAVHVLDLQKDTINIVYNEIYKDTIKIPQYFVTLSDDPDVENVYWIWMTSKYNRGCYYILSGSPFFDDFMASEDPGRPNAIYTVDYGYFARLPDTGFNGTDYQFDLMPYNVTVKYKIFTHISSFDTNYDKYFKSLLAYSDYLSLTDETPIYYKPSFVYSNVNNGTGIIGSYSTYMERL